VAPGVDLQRDVLDRAEFRLRVADRLAVMDAALFDPAPIGLQLGATAVETLR
jgi:propionate CoA-transferase